MRIGIDLDNTLIRYDAAFLAAAKSRGLVSVTFTGNKQQMRDHLRMQPEGEQHWQALQGYVYGAGIGAAELFTGAFEFLEEAHQAGIDLCIISHKTEFGHFDPAKVNLRDAARQFLRAHGVLDLIHEAHVTFHSTRAEKLARITEMQCDVFIDDLIEVLDDPAFPSSVRKLWFAEETSEHPGLERHGDWASIHRALLG